MERGCWRTTPEGQAAQATLQAAVDALTDEQWERLGGRPDGAKQDEALARIRARVAALRGQ